MTLPIQRITQLVRFGISQVRYSHSQFQFTKTGQFNQTAASFGHPYSSDWFLQKVLNATLPSEVGEMYDVFM